MRPRPGVPLWLRFGSSMVRLLSIGLRAEGTGSHRSDVGQGDRSSFWYGQLDTGAVFSDGAPVRKRHTTDAQNHRGGSEFLACPSVLGLGLRADRQTRGSLRESQ